MRSWAAQVGEWLRWLLGDAPLPSREARMKPAVTAVVTLLLIAGLLVTVREPSGAANAPAPSFNQLQGIDPVSPVEKAIYGEALAGIAQRSVGPRAKHPKRVARSHSTDRALGSHRNSGGGQSTTASANVGSGGSGSASTTTGTVGQPSSGSPPATQTPPAVTAPSGAPGTTSGWPGAPTDVAAVGGQGSVTISWSAPQTGGSSEVIGYNLYVGTAPGGEGTVPQNGSTPLADTTTAVSGLAPGRTYYFVVRAVNADGRTSAGSSEVSAIPQTGGSTTGVTGPFVGSAPEAVGSGGYWLVDSGGAVVARGTAVDYPGATGQGTPTSPVVGMASTPDGKGYWEVTTTGRVYAFGDAATYPPGPDPSSPGGQIAPVTAIASTPDGKGYWEVTTAGQVYAFGDAVLYPPVGGSEPQLGSPVVALVVDSTGKGYWEVTTAGQVYAFGDATSYGSAFGPNPGDPVVAAGPGPGGHGYLLVTAHGTVFTFGPTTSSVGTVAGSDQISSVAQSPTGGYWLVSWSGGVIGYGGASSLGNG
ncbi:MAG: fibronectin type III domain-containing protein [Acidimicrobiales bacterium]